MRILLMPNTFAPVLGGLQTATHNLAKHLLKNGHQVQVVTNRYPRSLPAHEMLDGIPIHRLLLLSPDLDSLRRRRPDLFLASWYFYPHSSWQLRNLMRSFRPRVVNVHFPDHQIPFVLGLRQQFEFRLVVSLHGHDVEKVRSDSLATKPLQSILRAADAITACSQHLLDQAIRVEPSITAKAQVIYNGVDPERFADKSFHFHPRPYVFAFGRLTHKKGFDMLLEAFAHVEGTAEETDLIIAGDGEERDALCLQAQQLGLTGRVHFRERATPEEVVRLLNGCLFVVVPSRSEPFGIVALEALAAGKPLLATNTGGLAEFLTEFNDSKLESEQSPNSLFQSTPMVTLVKPTVNELANGLRQMFELPLDVSNGTGDYRIADKYSWEQVTRCYESILDSSR